MQSLDSRLRELEERFTGFSLPQQPPGLAPLPALPSVAASAGTGSIGAAAAQPHAPQFPEPSSRPGDVSSALTGPSFRSWTNNDPPPAGAPPQTHAQQAPATAPAPLRGPQPIGTSSVNIQQQPTPQLPEANPAGAQLRPLPQRAPTPSEAPRPSKAAGQSLLAWLTQIADYRLWRRVVADKRTGSFASYTSTPQ